jgi:acyl-CoA thioesterase I
MRWSRNPIFLVVVSGALFVSFVIVHANRPTFADTGPGITPTATPPAVYAAIGASDAFGIGTSDPRKESWPVVLASKVGTSHLVDLGIPGATVELSLRAELPIALKVQPNLVTIWLGVNDLEANISRDTYIAQMSQLITVLQQQTHATIYVGNLPDLTLLPNFGKGDPLPLRQRIADWNNGIRDLCAEKNVTLVDIATSWVDIPLHQDYISGDGFHPSAKGALQIATLFAQAITTHATATPTSTPGIG